MEQLLTRKQAAERLGISVAVLDELRSLRQIAFIQHRPNAKVFFKQEALDAYLARCTQPARPVNATFNTYRKPRRRAV